MMDEAELMTYARGMAAALRLLEPTTRVQVVGMLHGLELNQDQAQAVIAFGLARGIFFETGEHLRAGRGRPTPHEMRIAGRRPTPRDQPRVSFPDPGPALDERRRGR